MTPPSKPWRRGSANGPFAMKMHVRIKSGSITVGLVTIAQLRRQAKRLIRDEVYRRRMEAVNRARPLYPVAKHERHR